jgi:hypothetical protein
MGRDRVVTANTDRPIGARSQRSSKANALITTPSWRTDAAMVAK